jgi:hypothetical protein
LIQGCFLEAGWSRGDLTEAEWRVLKDLLPIEPENRGCGRPPEQNCSIINASSGGFDAECHGETFRQNSAVGTPSTAGSGDGVKPGSRKPWQ